MLQPEHIRGRLRSLIIVADSSTTFLTEGNYKTDLHADITVNRTNVFPDFQGVEYIPSWGSNLTRLVQLAVDKINTWERAGAIDKTLSVDVMIVWNANELVGEKGLFLDPNYKPSTEKWRGRPHVAQGQWSFIGPKILRELHKLKELQRRPHVGTVLLTSATDHNAYFLPREWGTLMEEILDYAAQIGLAVKNFNVPATQIRKYDSYHFLEDTNHRRQLLRWIGATARIMVLRHQCSFFRTEDLDRTLVNYQHVPRPNARFAVGVQIDDQIFKRLQRTRAREVFQPLVEADPWDDVYFDGPAESFPTGAPIRLQDREFPNMVRLESGEYVPRDQFEASQQEAVDNAPRPGEAVIAASRAATNRDPEATKQRLLGRGEVFDKTSSASSSAAAAEIGPSQPKKAKTSGSGDEVIPTGYLRVSDDFQLVDMLGLDWDTIAQRPSDDEADWVILSPEDLPNFPLCQFHVELGIM